MGCEKMFNFFKNYTIRLQSSISISILMLILFILDTVNIVSITWLSIILLPFIIDIVACICDSLFSDDERMVEVNMSSKNEEIKKVLTEKKYLNILFITISIVIFLAGTVEAVMLNSMNDFICAVVATITFLAVSELRLKLEVSKEIKFIESKENGDV